MPERKDPFRQFSFLVEVDGITQAGFSECSGFGSSIDPIEYREGDESQTVRKLPSMTKHNNITLKRGLTASRDLFDWYVDITKGKVDRRNGSIVVMDTDGTTEAVRWNFYRGWPTKWDGGTLSATGNEVAIESLEIVVEGFERGTP
jgi:phage tail-like protein